MPEIRFNVYNDGSPTGHSNVTFIDDEENKTTIGATLKNTYFVNVLTRGTRLPTDRIFPKDGKIGNEESFSGGRTGAHVTVQVGQKDFDRAFSWAKKQKGKSFNYSLGTNDCTDFVQEVYKLAGFDGEYGRLFSPTDVAKSWSPVWRSIGERPHWIGGDKWSVVSASTGDYLTIKSSPPKTGLAQRKGRGVIGVSSKRVRNFSAGSL